MYRKGELKSKTKKRNRILAIVLAIIIIGIMIFTATGIYDSDFKGSGESIYHRDEVSE